MKKAFTMLELVFVIVVIGILAAAIIPSTRTNPLQEAAIQVLSHIRYTQHLAMMDDKYDATDANWYMKRWQIEFELDVLPDNDVGYTIFSDTTAGSNTVSDVTEMAISPSNPAKVLSGGTATIATTNTAMSKKLNLSKSYGITGLAFGANCNAATRLTFDHMGRPLQGDRIDNTEAYDGNDLIQNVCDITLSHAEGNIIIRVEKETGYSCILNAGGICI